MNRRAALAVALALLAACGRSDGKSARQKLFAPGATPAARDAFDWREPVGALRMGADEVAARLGSFDWTVAVSWKVARQPREGAARQVQASERHRVRQLASGDFAVEGDVDPGLGPGSESGKRVVWARGMTYARSRYAPSGAWRERPTDRGRDARRFRDESFAVAADVADLLGGSLRLQPAGEAVLLGRPVRRFSLALEAGAFEPGASALGEVPAQAGPDEDTRQRLAFLDGRVPAAVEGELVADAATGVPLEVRLRAVFRVKNDPEARVDVDLSGRMTALGGTVAPVEPPATVLPDERKPRGVARALEAAGLRKKKAPESRPEPVEEGE